MYNNKILVMSIILLVVVGVFLFNFIQPTETISQYTCSSPVYSVDISTYGFNNFESIQEKCEVAK